MENTNSSESNNSEQSSEVSSSQNENKSRAEPSNSSVRIAPDIVPAESSDAPRDNAQNTAREAKSSSSAPAPSRPGFSLRSSLLAPSTFSANASAQPDSSPPKPFMLNPPKLSNPFAKVLEEEEKDTNTDVPPKNDSPSKPSTSNSSEAKAVSFVPLAGGRSTGSGLNLPTALGAAPPTTSFVFGQNLRDKVVETPAPSDEVSSSNGSVLASSNGTSASSSSAVGKVFGSSEEKPKANGTTPAEMLFTSAVKGEVAETTTPSPDCEGAVGGTKSLSEAAKEYEESRQVKRKFEAVPVITGEEHEFNVLQMNCKLLAYDKASLGWQERGRGTLRLNDPAPPSSTSRLIVRAAGSLRLLLNTQIWDGMCVQRANQKSIRFTAVDSNGEMRIFVVMATVKEIDQLERCLEARVKLVTEMTKRPRLEAAR